MAINLFVICWLIHGFSLPITLGSHLPWHYVYIISFCTYLFGASLSCNCIAMPSTVSENHEITVYHIYLYLPFQGIFSCNSDITMPSTVSECHDFTCISHLFNSSLTCNSIKYCIVSEFHGIAVYYIYLHQPCRVTQISQPSTVSESHGIAVLVHCISHLSFLPFHRKLWSYCTAHYSIWMPWHCSISNLSPPTFSVQACRILPILHCPTPASDLSWSGPLRHIFL